ncbi:MAG: WecB/TagA/CpsF family glycosyltransferase [Bifidobacteriaceae bacterium]|nr:WecB/TagA/CpsF family glycosyltransferase [Bifidobacteriaceae bacterium]
MRSRPPQVTLVQRGGRVSLWGKEFFPGHMADALGRIGQLMATPGRHLVITPNVDLILLLKGNPAWRTAFHRGEMFLVDGMPVVALARLIGGQNLNRLTGADLLPAAAAAAPERGWRLAIVGGSDTARDRAIENLRQAHPGLEVQGFAVPMLQDPGDQICRPTVADLAAWAPNLVFLCLGGPKQELWFLAWEPDLPDAVYVGAGAAVDFVAGAVARAPLWMQRSGLEWLWRLSREPRRLAYRYLVRGPRFLGVAARSLARHLLHRDGN